MSCRAKARDEPLGEGPQRDGLHAHTLGEVELGELAQVAEQIAQPGRLGLDHALCLAPRVFVLGGAIGERERKT